MARVLDVFPSRRGFAPRDTTYPYDNWFDGQVWELEQGSDYQGKTQGMIGTLYTAAKKRGGRVRTQKCDKGLVIQFQPGVETVDLLGDDKAQPAA